MNKTAIKNFATWARNKLIADITYKAGLMGVTDKGISTPLPQSAGDMQFFDVGTSAPYSITGKEIEQRKRLADIITDKAKQSDYITAFNAVVEEVAYTWFNRLIAVRFMEVNDYLPSRVRMLSSESKGKAEPDLVTAPFDADLDFNSKEKELIAKLKLDNKLDELFRLLFIKQCNALNTILPELFEKISDYSEMLLGISYTDKDGVVAHLVSDIDEDDFRDQVQIIGWLYQYYNTEPKDETFALLKKNVKITKERVPTATQLFTPDWIVRYMVENSLGRLWLEHEQANARLTNEYLNGSYFGWKYYLEEAEQEESVQKQLNTLRDERKTTNLEDITVIDPCMGSGHILVYAFDVLIQIYESQGYNQRDAAKLILQNNIYGLDIDKRAYQLAYFSLMMKARQYNRRIFTEGVAPQVYCPDSYIDGEEYGSLLRVDELEDRPIEPEGQMTLDDTTYVTKLNAWNFRRLLAQKYDVVVTNPPYMSSSNMSGLLNTYLKKRYKDSKNDVFAAFIERNLELSKPEGFVSMVTMHSWMFLSRYRELRNKLLSGSTIENLAHLGARAFEEIGGEVVQTVAFIIRKSIIKGHKGSYLRLVDFPDAESKAANIRSNECAITCKQANFDSMVDSIIAYWVSDSIYYHFANTPLLEESGDSRQGIATGNNDLFLRLWCEVDIAQLMLNAKSQDDMVNSGLLYAPYIKGGGFRRWYGNQEYIIKMDPANYNLLLGMGNHLPSRQFYYKSGITWNDVSTSLFCARLVDDGFVFDAAGPMCFYNGNKYYLLGLLNTKVAQIFLNVVCQGLHYSTGHIPKVPIIVDNEEEVIPLAVESIAVSKMNCDSFETSWDFLKHPLLQFAAFSVAQIQEELKNGVHTENTMEDAYENWKQFVESQFLQLKANEEKLNHIFINIYGLQDELTPDVADKDVTVARIYDSKDDIPASMKGNGYVLTKADVVKSFISYAVGCMFGRYSLYEDGLFYAGGLWDYGSKVDRLSDAARSKGISLWNPSSLFLPDRDNIIPITDEEYFSDDIIGRFVEFVRLVYGTQTLEDNLEFIAAALGNKGNSSREIIRNYFVKDFFKDHCKTYQKRPIYWLFDSGKQDGFKALVYMHRYDENTIGNLRIDYLHRIQRVYDGEIVRMQDTIDNGTDGREIAAAEKRKEKLTKQLKETKDYDAKIAHLALARIAIDLDDGVKVNYEKIQTDTDGKKLDVLGKI